MQYYIYLSVETREITNKFFFSKLLFYIKNSSYICIGEMDLTVNVKQNGHGNDMNHNGSDNYMNQNGQGNLMSHDEQRIPMSNQGLCNSMNNVGNSIGNSSLKYESSGPPNTMNNTYVNQADSFWNSIISGLNNGPGRDDTVNKFTSNNSNNADCETKLSGSKSPVGEH